MQAGSILVLGAAFVIAVVELATLAAIVATLTILLRAFRIFGSTGVGNEHAALPDIIAKVSQRETVFMMSARKTTYSS